MIGVGMGKNDSIDTLDVIFQRLDTKIRGGVYKNIFPSTRTIIDERVRSFFGSEDWQTEQSQPIIGTPVDAPVPIKRTSMASPDGFLGDSVEVSAPITSSGSGIDPKDFYVLDDNRSLGTVPAVCRNFGNFIRHGLP